MKLPSVRVILGKNVAASGIRFYQFNEIHQFLNDSKCQKVTSQSVPLPLYKGEGPKKATSAFTALCEWVNASCPDIILKSTKIASIIRLSLEKPKFVDNDGNTYMFQYP